MNEKAILLQYLPQNAVEEVYNEIVNHNIHLRIAKKRTTKLGDYRPPMDHENHRISINHDLNPYAFLITFIHELAHLKVFEKYKNKVAPHGIEWKQIYKRLILKYLVISAFPDDIAKVLQKSIENSKASSTSDLRLSRVLQQYDKPNGQIRIEDLPEDAVFNTKNGNQFRKGNRVRTRYRCLNLKNKKTYLFHPLTPVFPA